MKKLFTLLVLLITTLGYSQGQGFINYKSYKINGGDGLCGPQHPSTTEAFDTMFDHTNNTCTELTHEGIDTALNGLTWTWSTMLPRHANQWFGWDIQGYFVPPTSGMYSFQISSDDRSDFWFDTDGDGVIEDSNAGFGNGTRVVQFNVTAGQPYPFRVRYEQGEGGASLYLKWLSPEDEAAGAAYAFNSNSIYSYNPETYVEPLHYDVNFKFGNGIDPSTFSLNTFNRVSPQQLSQNSNSNTIGLDVNGEATITTQIDETLTADGTNKIVALAGVNGIAAVISPSGFGPNETRFYIDNRMFDSGFDFSTVTHIEMLDLFSGPLEFQNTDPSSIWQFYKISGYEPDRVQMSQVSNWRDADGGGYTGPGVVYEMNPQNNYPLPDFVITNDWEVQPNQGYKEQYVIFEPIPNLQTIVDGIITVSDVYLAFTELSGGGLLGGFAGNYEYGIQYSNSDINRDGVFDFNDTFIMLDYLNGGTLFDTSYLAGVMKLIQTDKYNSISSTNWNGYTTQTMYPLNLNTTDKLYDINVSVSWLGDVNLSHSPLPTNNLSITGKSISKSSKDTSSDININLDVEHIDGSIVVTLSIPENTKNIVGSEFKIAYDNTRVSYDKMETSSDLQTFTAKRTSYIKLGSISTDGTKTINGGDEYKIYFTPQQNMESILGLISIIQSELISKDGNQVGVIIK